MNEIIIQIIGFVAVAAFILLKILGPGIGPVEEGRPKLNVPQWLLEGASFSLLGIVFMKKNNQKPAPDRPRSGKVADTVQSNGFSEDSDKGLW